VSGTSTLKNNRRDPLRDQLADLAALRDLPPLGDADPRSLHRQKLLRSALSGKSCFAVAAAADLLTDSDHDLLAMLDATFARFAVDAVRSDKGCTAKCAIAKALERVDAQDDRAASARWAWRGCRPSTCWSCWPTCWRFGNTARGRRRHARWGARGAMERCLCCASRRCAAIANRQC
jgi:hypothetical protein